MTALDVVVIALMGGLVGASLGYVGGWNGCVAWTERKLREVETAKDIVRRIRGTDDVVTGIQCARCFKDVNDCLCSAEADARRIIS